MTSCSNQKMIWKDIGKKFTKHLNHAEIPLLVYSRRSVSSTMTQSQRACIFASNVEKISKLKIIHRKIHEGDRLCRKFANNICLRGNECCWRHEVESDPTKLTQGFQQNPENLAPPLKYLSQPLASAQTWPQPNQPLNPIQLNQIKTNNWIQQPYRCWI